jgi:hypothetical protein
MDTPFSWQRIAAATQFPSRAQDPFSMPSNQMAEITPNMQQDDYLRMLVDEEFEGREFANA